MIPKSIINYFAQEGDSVLRKDASPALEALRKLCKTHESRRGRCPAAVDLVLTQLLR